jgi:hypothetical protein
MDTALRADSTIPEVPVFSRKMQASRFVTPTDSHFFAAKSKHDLRQPAFIGENFSNSPLQDAKYSVK